MPKELQEEYDAKMKQLVPEEEETSPQKETAGLSELETLIHLKNEKVITQDEYAQKAAHILGIATFPKESSKKIAASGSCTGAGPFACASTSLCPAA